MLRLNERDIPTLTLTEAEGLNVLKGKIINAFDVDKLILFGSKARGDYSEDSDVDILVVAHEEDSHENRLKLYAICFEVNIKFLTDFSCKLRNIKKWFSGEGDFPTFVADVMEEGIEIEA